MKEKKFIPLQEAHELATEYLGREVTPSNIMYLVQYARILRYDENGRQKKNSAGVTMISVDELKNYYESLRRRDQKWKEHLGPDVTWELAFGDITERERTKHVHRLHPYKGKFIPQLTEYFLDEHTSESKKEPFFHKGDTVLDPFVGSGTTLVQCAELGLNSVGVDISKFNCWISQVKIQEYDIADLRSHALKALKSTQAFSKSTFHDAEDKAIREELSNHNLIYFPNPEFKILIQTLRKLQRTASKKTSAEDEINSFLNRLKIDINFHFGEIDEQKIVNEFTKRYSDLVINENLDAVPIIQQERLFPDSEEGTMTKSLLSSSPFLSKWFTERQLLEMDHYLGQINEVEDVAIQKVLRIILSRTVRSTRATTHSDLATLVEPQTEPYYCTKHYKICTPIRTIIQHLRRYTRDTISRIETFSKLREDVFAEVLNADSTSVNVFKEIKKKNKAFSEILSKRKIDGIFTSPPYLGLIDYHEQHAYAYELFDIERKDDQEIGRMSNGSSQKAQQEYVRGISEVLLNMKKYMKDDAHIFIVANDSFNLYPLIAKESGLRIVKEYKRPVLRRSERDKQPYSESIFHMVP